MESIANILAQHTYGKSADPAHADNLDSAEFQKGYSFGLEKGREDGVAQTSDEYFKRGGALMSDTEKNSFKEWKRGYWAAVFTRITEKQNA